MDKVMCAACGNEGTSADLAANGGRWPHVQTDGTVLYPTGFKQPAAMAARSALKPTTSERDVCSPKCVMTLSS